MIKEADHLMAQAIRIVADLYKDGIIDKPESYAYPFPDLCGAGIAWKLAQGLGASPEELTQYAVLGTVADMVPLKGENRVIARFGLDRLNQAVDRGDPGLAALAGIVGE